MHAPGGFAFAELLERDWFLACSVVWSVLEEELVDGSEEVPRHLFSLTWPSLYYLNEITEVNFDMC